ncbi:hypothetical protein HPB47_017829 [Ixodes persulcatus]|uniref:Uncharacterized protein n=1 Tax=Ixodes persulcatus TaxID=34615 RepID=A0AC60QMB1_IXOPE|nr:hypothetical protein HPB47_017829 [Ixodes persulcatus]
MNQSQACATASVTAPESSAENNSEEPPPPQADAEMACSGEDGQIEEDLSLEDLERLKREVAEQAIQILRLNNQCDFLKESCLRQRRRSTNCKGKITASRNFLSRNKQKQQAFASSLFWILEMVAAMCYGLNVLVGQEQAVVGRGS